MPKRYSLVPLFRERRLRVVLALPLQRLTRLLAVVVDPVVRAHFLTPRSPHAPVVQEAAWVEDAEDVVVAVPY